MNTKKIYEVTVIQSGGEYRTIQFPDATGRGMALAEARRYGNPVRCYYGGELVWEKLDQGLYHKFGY